MENKNFKNKNTRFEIFKGTKGRDGKITSRQKMGQATLMKGHLLTICILTRLCQMNLRWSFIC